MAILPKVMVPKAMTKDLLKIKILECGPKSTESKTLVLRASNLCLNKPSR